MYTPHPEDAPLEWRDLYRILAPLHYAAGSSFTRLTDTDNVASMLFIAPTVASILRPLITLCCMWAGTNVNKRLAASRSLFDDMAIPAGMCTHNIVQCRDLAPGTRDMEALVVDRNAEAIAAPWGTLLQFPLVALYAAHGSSMRPKEACSLASTLGCAAGRALFAILHLAQFVSYAGSADSVLAKGAAHRQRLLRRIFRRFIKANLAGLRLDAATAMDGWSAESRATFTTHVLAMQALWTAVKELLRLVPEEAVAQPLAPSECEVLMVDVRTARCLPVGVWHDFLQRKARLPCIGMVVQCCVSPVNGTAVSCDPWAACGGAQYRPWDGAPAGQPPLRSLLFWQALCRFSASPEAVTLLMQHLEATTRRLAMREALLEEVRTELTAMQQQVRRRARHRRGAAAAAVATSHARRRPSPKRRTSGSPRLEIDAARLPPAWQEQVDAFLCPLTQDLVQECPVVLRLANGGTSAAVYEYSAVRAWLQHGAGREGNSPLLEPTTREPLACRDDTVAVQPQAVWVAYCAVVALLTTDLPQPQLQMQPLREQRTHRKEQREGEPEDERDEEEEQQSHARKRQRVDLLPPPHKQ